MTGLVRALLEEGADLGPPVPALPARRAGRPGRGAPATLDSQARATIEILTVIEHRVELSGLLPADRPAPSTSSPSSSSGSSGSGS